VSEEHGIPAIHRAILAAAVTAVLGENAVIRQVREIDAAGAGGWVRRGRTDIQGSHNLAPLIREVRQREFDKK
jgi:hypothetical protein